VDQVKDLPGDLVDNAVRANAKMVAEQLRSSQPVLSELANAGALKIVAARYDLDTGVVELLQA
jgi:carbonic anhydrase